MDFNVAGSCHCSCARRLGRSSAEPLPAVTNLVGEDNGRTALIEQDADGCESSLSVEVTPARLPCHRWRRGARAQDLHGPDQARFRGSESSLSTPAAGREALVRMNAV